MKNTNEKAMRITPASPSCPLAEKVKQATARLVKICEEFYHGKCKLPMQKEKM
jgi:hypothetical protein